MKPEKVDYSRKVIEDNMDNSKSFWKTINNILPSGKKFKESISSIVVNNCVISEKSAIAESCKSFFGVIVNKIDAQLNYTLSGT